VERRIRLHLESYFGRSKAKDITASDGQGFVSQRQAAKASNGEINRELTLLKRMYNLGIQSERINRKPYIQRLEENNIRQGFFERYQFDAVLIRLPDYLRPPVTLAYQVGWRILTEVLSLTWDQIELEAGTVRLEPGTTKTEEGSDIVPPPMLRGVIESQWQNHLSSYPECPWVFHRTGKRIQSFYKAWHRACREAGIPGKVPHDFRRTAIRNMVRAGIPERVAMAIAGHKTRAIFDRYHIVADGDLQEAAQRIEAAFMAQTATTLATCVVLPEMQPLVSH